MATPTEALNELNNINNKYILLKNETLKLLDEENRIREKINDNLEIIRGMEEKYVYLMEDLTVKENDA